MRVEVEVAFSLANESQVNTEHESDTDSAETNVSRKTYMTSEDNYSYRGKRGFQFAAVRGEWPAISDGSYQYFPDSGYHGFMSQALSDVNGDFATPVQVSIEIYGKIPYFLFIQFDRILNLYATQLVIKNNYNSNTVVVNNKRSLVYIDLSVFNFGFEDIPEDNPLLLTVTFSQVNRAYQSLRLTQLSLTFRGIYTENELISVENSEQLFDSQMSISPGIVEQYADIKVYDRTGIIHDLAKKEILASRQNVTIRAYTDDGEEVTLGIYKANDWDVTEGSNEVDITCADTTEQLDKRWSNMAEIDTRSVDDLLTMAFAVNGSSVWRYIDSDTETYCKNIITPNSWYYNSTVKELLEKICQLGQLRIYDYLGEYVVARCY